MDKEIVTLETIVESKSKDHEVIKICKLINKGEKDIQ